MKFKVTMKDPDTPYDAIRDAVRDEVQTMENVDAEEKESISEIRYQRYAKTASKWFKYGELLTVEIDTDAETCVVVPNQQ